MAASSPDRRRRLADPERGHDALPHTADIGLRAWAADLEALFEEAALGLAELALGRPGDRTDGHRTSVRVELEADDLVALAYAWLNELIGLGEIHRAAIDGVSGVRIEGRAPARLTGRVDLRAFDAIRSRPLRDLKAATYHGLAVGRTRAGWSLVAYLDV